MRLTVFFPGSLPPELGRLRALLTLEMQDNHLEGAVHPDDMTLIAVCVVLAV